MIRPRRFDRPLNRRRSLSPLIPPSRRSANSSSARLLAGGGSPRPAISERRPGLGRSDHLAVLRFAPTSDYDAPTGDEPARNDVSLLTRKRSKRISTYETASARGKKCILIYRCIGSWVATVPWPQTFAIDPVRWIRCCTLRWRRARWRTTCRTPTQTTTTTNRTRRRRTSTRFDHGPWGGQRKLRVNRRRPSRRRRTNRSRNRPRWANTDARRPTLGSGTACGRSTRRSKRCAGWSPRWRPRTCPALTRSSPKSPR